MVFVFCFRYYRAEKRGSHKEPLHDSSLFQMIQLLNFIQSFVVKIPSIPLRSKTSNLSCLLYLTGTHEIELATNEKTVLHFCVVIRTIVPNLLKRLS